MTQPLPIFVYGTLKRGEAREGKWPRRPTRIEGATTLGALYHLGPYPALVPGQDVVEGELWHLAPEDIAETLRVLDAEEGCLPEGENLYQRREVTCRNDAGQMQKAQAYFYARPADLQGKTPLRPGGNGCVRWQSRP